MDTIKFAIGCEDERQAAIVLGYDGASWNSTEVEQPASTNKNWDDMTEEEQAALQILGYSQHGWDTRDPHSNNQYWGDLTEDERAAAELLGYRSAKWNDRKGTAKPPDHVGKMWSQLTNNERAALRVLGYRKKLWDYGATPRPRSFFKGWNELTVCGESLCHLLL